MFGLSKRPPRKIVFRWYLIVTRNPIQQPLAKHVPAIEIELIRAVSRSCSAITDRPAALTVRQVRNLPGVDKQNLVEIERIKGRSWLYENFSRVLLTLANWFGTARWQRFLVSVTSHFMVKRVTWNVLATEQRRLGHTKAMSQCQ